MGPRMQWLRVLGVLCVTGSFAAGCATGKDVKSASKDDKLAYDEVGQRQEVRQPEVVVRRDLGPEPRLQREVP